MDISHHIAPGEGKGTAAGLHIESHGCEEGEKRQKNTLYQPASSEKADKKHRREKEGGSAPEQVHESSRNPVAVICLFHKS